MKKKKERKKKARIRKGAPSFAFSRQYKKILVSPTSLSHLLLSAENARIGEKQRLMGPL